jgi:anthranilate synthase component 1
MKPPFDIAADLDTPVSAYLKLGPFKPRFLLESVEGGERLARYSFIGFGDCLEVRLDSAGFDIGGIHTPRPRSKAAFLDALRGALARAPQPLPEIPGVPLSGGLVGYTAYDAVRYFERVPGRGLDDTESPHAHYVAPRSLLVFDHLTHGVALLHDGSEAERQSLRREVVQALRGGVPTLLTPGRFSPAVPSLTEAAHAQGVQRAQEYIASGDVYQLVLSSRFAGRHSLSPFEVYRALRMLNPSPYMYFCELGDITVVGSSPEALVKSHGGHAQLRPIAGSRPRGADALHDADLEAELLADPKENAEHVMLVDLARNDLGRVATAGSVRVDPEALGEDALGVVLALRRVHEDVVQLLDLRHPGESIWIEPAVIPLREHVELMVEHDEREGLDCQLIRPAVVVLVVETKASVLEERVDDDVECVAGFGQGALTTTRREDELSLEIRVDLAALAEHDVARIP